MRFSYIPGQALSGVLTYSEEEYSFRFDVDSVDDLAARIGHAGQASVLIGSLQLEVAARSGEVLFVWGLHPRVRWVEGRVSAPPTESGNVRLDADFSPGVSISLVPIGEWITAFDPRTGWLRVTDDQNLDDHLVVEVASGILLGERLGVLSSIWLHPRID